MMPTFLSKTFLSFQGGMIQMRASTKCQLAGMISARESKQDICSWHIKSIICRGLFFQMVTTTDTSKAFYIIAFTVFNPLLAFISIEIYIFNLVRFPLYLLSSNVCYEDFSLYCNLCNHFFFLHDACFMYQAVLAVCTKSPQGQLISVGRACGLQKTRKV